MPSDDYEEYERAAAKIREENGKLLDEFAEWLAAKGLGRKTVQRHVQNVDFYANEFLLHDNATPAREGAGRISMFLGYWFIRKAAWASPSSIRENASSLKKFYTFMREKGKIKAEELEDVKETIKEEMPEWLATLGRFDDPDITDPEEIWGL